MKRQNKRKISVIIGNPPYNANQANENDNNKNRAYPRIDELIKSSYIRLSNAQKTKVYDMYARFFRWASDRLHDDGVLAFVTNSSFVDKPTYDGFRRAVASDFHEIYVVDLKGNARTSGERRRREGGNVFQDQIRVGIAVSFWVKKRKAQGCTIRYESVRDYAKSDDKLSFLSMTPLRQRPFSVVEPDKEGNWIGSSEDDWHDLLPVADKKTKTAKSRAQENAIFRLYSLGMSTNRDEWLYDFKAQQLEAKAALLIRKFDSTERKTETFPAEIKWSRNLKRRHRSGQSERHSGNLIREANYRPFAKRWFYQSELFVDELGDVQRIFPVGRENQAICVSDKGSRSEMCILAIDGPADLHFGAAIDAYQQLPRYRYNADNERIDNITDWALKEFQKAYGKDGRGTPAKAGEAAESVISPLVGEMSAKPTEGGGQRETPPSALTGISPTRGEIGQSRKPRALTKDDIFHYVYGVLHDPVYREKYALNLKREFPRIPFYPDFWRWAEWGEKLMALHIGYETVEPWPLTRTDTPDEKAREAGVTPKAMLKADRDNGIIRLDTETTLSGIPAEAWDYRLGNRSGLDWILDQYKEKTPKDPTIREKFNTYRFADYKEKVADLIARVARVSVETVAITEAMKGARR